MKLKNKMDRWDNIPGSQLFNSEIIVFTCDQVGLYHENERMLMYDNGTITLTNHRILWKSASDNTILSLSLGLVEKFVLNKSLIMGHPKIDIKLRSKEVVPQSYLQNLFYLHPSAVNQNEKWKCEICFFEENLFFQSKCRECGVRIKISEIRFWACSQCTFHNRIEHKNCEICQYAKDIYVSDSSSIKLSFRGSGSKSFFEKLTASMLTKEWEAKDTTSVIKSSSDSTGGINGLLKRFENDSQLQNMKLNDAFSDLDNLMIAASEMVKMAESLSSKISKEDQDSYRSLISSIGIDNPVTKDVYRDTYFESLADQVCSYLSSLIDKDKRFQIVSMIDFYCLYNRARGTSLVAPEDLMKACSILESRRRFNVKRYKSGVVAIVSEHYDESEYVHRLVNILNGRDSISILEWSKHEGIGITIAEEQLLSMEECGIICRDEHGLETERPYLQWGKFIFQGEYRETVGTDLIYDKRNFDDPSVSGKRIIFRRIALKKKMTANEENEN